MVLKSKSGGIEDDLSLGIMEVFRRWMRISACLESSCGHFAVVSDIRTEECKT